MIGGRYFAATGVLALFSLPAAYGGQAKPAAAPAAHAEAGQASIANGQALFKRYCQGCHGETGKGDGPAAKYLTGKLPDLSGKATIAERTDADLHDLIAKGRKGESGTMPPFSARLKDPEIQDLINFARSLGH